MSPPPVEILLIEDELADAHLVKIALREGHVLSNLHHVLDGVEGLAFLRCEGKYQGTPTPDLILLDLNMPRMDGKEFLRHLKADPSLNTIPVVVLTTSDVERDITASYQLGASGYITKPVDMEQFIQAVKQIENYWFTLVKLPKVN